MLTPTEAARLILEHIAPLPAARRPLRETLDRVLAEDVKSPIDLPAWDNSAMDGYAARAVDVESAAPDHAVALAVIEAVAAGQFPTKPIGPGQLGVLASIAHATPLVYDAPRVAFMGSGDEIVDLDRADDILSGNKVATSNSYTLHALIKQNGGIPVDLGLARDTKESLRDHFAAARQGSDLLVTTAGVSVGEHDFVREVLTELGGEIKLWRIAMRPGAPVGFGLLGETPWIGLPGNPVSAMVTFELFVRPAIRRMLGHRLPFRRTVPVCVGEPIKLGPKLRHFLRAVVVPEGSVGGGGKLTARLTGPQGSGILTSMARANALLIVPEDRPSVAAGETLPALLLDDPHHVAEAPF